MACAQSSTLALRAPSSAVFRSGIDQSHRVCGHYVPEGKQVGGKTGEPNNGRKVKKAQGTINVTTGPKEQRGGSPEKRHVSQRKLKSLGLPCAARQRVYKCAGVSACLSARV